MRQILIILVAMAAGLGLGRLTGGLAFSSSVCIVAGVFLVTPSLFRFETKDIRFALHELKPLGRNLVLNFLVLPLAALAIGWATRDIGLAAALILLALLPGGGMVIHWIKSSGADLRLGFLLSAVNLAVIAPVTFLFAALPDLLAPLFPPTELGPVSGQGPGIPPFGPMMVLVVLPFILSRLAKSDAPQLVVWVERHQRAVSQAVIAGIVFYLFALSSSQLLFAVAPATFVKALLATGAFYAGTIALAARVAPKTSEGRAVFWHLVTRYITLALIFASFSAARFGPSFLLPIMIAYPIQFAAAGLLSRRMAR